MILFKKISLLFIVVSILCGEEVFARHHHSRHSDDREISRSAKRLHKARKEERRADRNAEKKRQKRIRAERRFNRKTERKFNQKIERHQNRRFVRRRSAAPLFSTPQDEWVRVDRDGMSEITRIRYRNVLYRGKRLATPMRLPQKPITVPTFLAERTLAHLKAMAAREPKLSPIVVKNNRRKRSFF